MRAPRRRRTSIRRLLIAAAFAAGTLVIAITVAQAPPPPSGPASAPTPDGAGKARVPSTEALGQLAEKLDDGVFRIGNVRVDRRRGCLLVRGRVNQQEGLVEVLAAGPEGKLHESVLELAVDPYHVQVGLLLLGLEPGPMLSLDAPPPETLQGDPVDVFVRWSAEGTEHRHPAHELVFNVAQDRPMQPTPWIFVGSLVVDGVFMAALEQSIVTTYRDPMAILDNPLPQGMDDTLYHANERVLPKAGTPVEVELCAARAARKAPAAE